MIDTMMVITDYSDFDIDPYDLESEEELIKALEEIEENEAIDWRDKHTHNEFGLDPYEFETKDEFLIALDMIIDPGNDIDEQKHYSIDNNVKNTNKSKMKTEPVKEKINLISQMPKGTRDIFESNPYCVLGIPCNSTRNKALEMHDKLKKLHKLDVLSTYKSKFDLKVIEQPKRDLGNINVVISNLDKIEFRWFWFLSEEYSKLWNKPILVNNIQDWDFDYDRFLIRYIAVLVIDPAFTDHKKWSFVIKMLDRLCLMPDPELYKILSSRISDSENKKYNYRMITSDFRENILQPLVANIESAVVCI